MLPKIYSRSSTIKDAISTLKQGKIVLMHDMDDRENETDMVIAAQNVTPDHIRRMRKDAGGLICVAMRFDTARKLGLPYMSDVLQIAGEKYPHLLELINSQASYGRSTFSISVNHRRTFTGITDLDRALTIKKIARLCDFAIQGLDDVEYRFASNFRAPGHVQLLIASDGLISNRVGHTELSVYLAQLAGLTPVTVICEMLDDRSHRSLPPKSAQDYAKIHGIPFIEGYEVASYYKIQMRGKT
ncbi:MAG: 3,4-dihydroxy-2-butanone-4-phosphate synthase [Candidatus Methylarchaceae archaeon HK02M1]|nr:3,4-dihydroxy-2-butanone-4-phosphate synthase [Candidatus Methylarchaceae archaeon HK01M]MCP8312636.1 3,4-dihydroxy-2-butanone-4-phosphate synthase [Candidatus Methylarchaceae archaeon HK02M1]